MEDKITGSVTGSKPTTVGKTIKLKTLYMIIAGIVVMVGGFFCYQFLYREQPFTVTDIARLSDFRQPRFLFTLYGAKGVKFVRPMSTYIDDQEELLCVSNTEAHTVDVFKAHGEYVFSFGGFGSEPGKMSYPYGIVKRSNGDLLVAEAGNQRVQRFSAKGEYLGTLFDQPNEYLIEKPGPLYIDRSGNIYIGDLSGEKVVVLDEQGRVVRTYSQAAYPHGIAVDDKNRLVYITNGGARAVNVYSLDLDKKDIGSQDVIRQIGSMPGGTEKVPFGMVRGIAVDKSGNLYVVDSLNSSVRVFDAEGEYRYSIGSPGNDDRNLLYPNGITAGEDGRVYISDWANNRIVVWGY